VTSQRQAKVLLTPMTSPVDFIGAENRVHARES
jgi:hypothetical protein